MDYPVKYTPKKTGLEQEQALEASALPSSHVPCHAPTQSVINDPTDEEYQDFIDLIHHIDDDDDDSDEDQNNVDKSIVKFVNDAGAHDYVPEIPPKSTGNNTIHIDIDGLLMRFKVSCRKYIFVMVLDWFDRGVQVAETVGALH